MGGKRMKGKTDTGAILFIISLVLLLIRLFGIYPLPWRIIVAPVAVPILISAIIYILLLLANGIAYVITEIIDWKKGDRK
jgi:hypothetical protein